jgi:uncharacterized protein YkwD
LLARARKTAGTLCAMLAALAASLTGSVSAAVHLHRGVPAQCPEANLTPTGGDAAAVEAATLCLIDRVRATHRLPALRANRALAAAAATKVRRMLRHDYFADGEPTGGRPLALVASSPYARFHRVQLGQNIGWGTGSDATPAGIVAAWMASPPHRAIILGPAFRDAGVAVVPAIPAVLANAAGATYAMEFGVRVH